MNLGWRVPMATLVAQLDSTGEAGFWGGVG